jgi:hypothetical protein
MHTNTMVAYYNLNLLTHRPFEHLVDKPDPFLVVERHTLRRGFYFVDSGRVLEQFLLRREFSFVHTNALAHGGGGEERGGGRGERKELVCEYTLQSTLIVGLIHMHDSRG